MLIIMLGKAGPSTKYGAASEPHIVLVYWIFLIFSFRLVSNSKLGPHMIATQSKYGVGRNSN